MGRLKEFHQLADADEWAQYEALERKATETHAEKKLELIAANDYPIRRRDAKKLAEKVARDAMLIASEQRHSNRGQYAWADFDDEARNENEAADELRALCTSFNVEYPVSEYGKACEIARLCSPDWWGRKLRIADWREWEMRKIATAEVRRYCSDEIAQAHKWHKEEIQALLEDLIAARDDDAVLLTLGEIAKTSKANPVIRRAQMVRMAKGLARLAESRGWSWAFWTLTCPSKFHRLTTREVREDGKKKRLEREPNPKWSGASPRDAQLHLRKVFERVRAKLDRMGIEYFYCRVAEPHLDACPHWHGIFWCAPADLERVRQVLRHYGLEEDGDEAGAQRRRVQWRKYRKQAYEGDIVDAAIAYLIAYIGKNIDGYTSDDECMGETLDRERQKVDGTTVENAARVQAWASTWGIRQFQFGGGAAVGPYEELRRIRHEVANNLEEARKAADQGDFATYTREAQQLGLSLVVETSADRIGALADALGLPREASPELAEAATAAGLFNRWGEPARRWVLGVTDGLAEIRTRLHTWRIVTAEQFRREAPEQASELLPALEERRASSRASEAARLGPGQITVRSSGLQPGGAMPPDEDPTACWDVFRPFRDLIRPPG